MEGLRNVHHYLDDIVPIATETCEEHVDVHQSFLEHIEQTGLTVQPKKSQVGFTLVNFFGHFIGRSPLQAQPEILENIHAAKLPETKKVVWSFLDLTGYYRDFVPNFSEVACPLAEWIRNKVIRREKELDTFAQLEWMLSSQLILQAPDLLKPFMLCANASSQKVGGPPPAMPWSSSSSGI